MNDTPIKIMKRVAQVYKPMAGDSIEEAARVAVFRAKTFKQPVEFYFNEIGLNATEDTNPEDIVRDYHEKRKIIHDEWLNSPEHVSYRKQRNAELLMAQRCYDFLLKVMGDTFESGVENMLVWLRFYAQTADRRDLKTDHHRVYVKLLDMGYQENLYLGLSPEAYQNPITLSEYIIGQAMDSLKRDMPPHPVIEKFIEQYFQQITTEEPCETNPQT